MENMNFEIQNIENSNKREISLVELLSYIWKKIGYVIFAVAFISALAFCFTHYFTTPTYRSTTKMYILNRTDETAITYNDLQTGTSLTQDYMSLVTCRPVLETVISHLNLDMTVSELESLITVTNPTNTRILVLDVIYTDREMAQKIADAVREASGNQIKQIMLINDVKVVENANYPDNIYAPNILLNTIIGALIGFVISVGVVFIKYTLDDKIKTVEDVEKQLKLVVIGSIPKNEYFKGKNKSKKNHKNSSYEIRKQEKEILNKFEEKFEKRVDSQAVEKELEKLISEMSYSQSEINFLS